MTKTIILITLSIFALVACQSEKPENKQIQSEISHSTALFVNQIIEDMNRGNRLDTVVHFSQQNKLEYLPLTIFKGQNPGPVCTIVSGVHGYEYPPIVAVQDLMKDIDAKQLQGTLVILPIANIASFYGRSPFVNPIDQLNLNTSFPGTVSGTITERIAHWITQEIIPVSDVFLDIHGGDAGEDLMPFICYYDNNDSQTNQAHQLSEASGMEYIVSYPYTITKTEPAKYAFKQAVQDGIVGLSIEAGKLGNVQDKNVEIIKNAVYNMLDYSKMYKAGNPQVEIEKKYLDNQSYIRVPGNGIFYSSIKSGDNVVQGQELGYITDDFGNVVHQISSPISGIVLYKVGTPPVNKGEALFCIGY